MNTLILKNTMLNKPKLDNIITTTTCILNNRIPGDFVECGVWKGGSVGLMAETLLNAGVLRNLWLFDSFDDICEPSAIDGARAIKEVGGLKNG